jgi:hypothetical protein
MTNGHWSVVIGQFAMINATFENGTLTNDQDQ